MNNYLITKSILYIFCIIIAPVFLVTMSICASDTFLYQPYNEIHSLSKEKLEYTGPDIVGPMGLRGFRYGIVTVFFVQGETEYRYKWFVSDSERAYLVKKITETIYQMPYNILKNIKPGEINLVILPPKLEQYSRMGGEPWVVDIIGRACGSRVELREVFFTDWERNKDILNLVILHELTHLLVARNHLSNRIGVVELEKEVFADVAAMTWYKIAKHTYSTPRNDTEYFVLLTKEFELQKPAILESSDNSVEDLRRGPVVQKINNDYKEQYPEKKIWGLGIAHLSDEYYKGYNFMVNLELSDGSAASYVANKQMMSYSLMTEDLYKKCLFDSFENEKKYLDEEIVKNILEARNELADYLLVQNYGVFPVSIKKHKDVFNVTFAMELFHKNWGKCFLNFPYAISATSYRLIQNIKPEPMKAEKMQGF